MNSTDLSLIDPALIISPDQNPPKIRKFGWLRLMAGNPFFLISPVLLLFGLFQVATEPQMLGQEEASLAFNFSSLGIYEMMLVVTAVWLAGRRLRYDAGMLVWLENVLLFVPFLLLSQASFLETGTAMMYALIAVGLAVARWTLQYRYFPQINLPPLLLIIGCGLLLLNACLPLLHHFLITVKEDNWLWPILRLVFWGAVLPTVMLLGNWLCRPTEGRELLQGHWVPVAFLSVWMVGTAVNVRAISYVDGFEFEPGLAVPLVWALAWTLWLQAGNLFGQISYRLHDRLVWIPVALPTAGAMLGEYVASFGLVIVNCAAVMSLGRRISTKTRWNAVAVGAGLLVFTLPTHLAEELVPFFTRGKCLVLGLAVLGMWLTVRRLQLRLGLVGAALAGLTTQYYFGRLDYLEQFALDTALMFALLHSLGWNDSREPVGRPIRFALGLGWVIHGVVWLRIAAGDVPETTQFIARTMPLSGLLVFACSVAYHLRTKRWEPLMVPAMAVLAMLTVPLNSGFDTIRITPIGHLAVLGSFVCFVAGVGYAFVRDQVARNAGEYARAVHKELSTPIRW